MKAVAAQHLHCMLPRCTPATIVAHEPCRLSGEPSALTSITLLLQARAEKELGLRLQDLQTTLKSAVDSMVAHGYVAASASTHSDAAATIPTVTAVAGE